jgi:hypothetical protein
LPPKEKTSHTVQGPTWSPQSSVGFVMGAQSEGRRIWSATAATDDTDGLLGNNGEPSILARALTTTIAHGWMARAPELHERYGNTSRQPHVVFTPPLSPRNTSVEGLRNIMDVKAGWSDLPMPPNELARLAAPIPKKQTDFLKKFRLSRDDADEYLDVLRRHTTGNYDEDLDISRMVEMRHDNPDLFYALMAEDFGNYDMLCAFTTDNAFSFFREYSDEIDISSMIEIYHNNPDLFCTLINDPDNLLQDIGVDSFITRYQRAQAVVAAIPENDPYYGSYDAYDVLRHSIAIDGCQDELLRDDDSVNDDNARDASDAENSDNNNSEDGDESEVTHPVVPNRGAAAGGIMYEVGSIEYTQEVLFGCIRQIAIDTLLRAKLGDEFLQALESISDTFTSHKRNATTFVSTQRKVDEVVAFLRDSLQGYEHIKWMREFSMAFPKHFVLQKQDGAEDDIAQYESLLHSLHIIDRVNCILGDVAYYYDVG